MSLCGFCVSVLNNPLLVPPKGEEQHRGTEDTELHRGKCLNYDFNVISMMKRIRDMRYAICDVNPKDSNVYRKMACRLTCDSFGVEYRDGRPYSINIRPLRGHGVVGDGNVETHNNVETHGRASLRHRCPPSPPPPVIAGYDPQSHCFREIAGQARNDGMARRANRPNHGSHDLRIGRSGRTRMTQMAQIYFIFGTSSCLHILLHRLSSISLCLGTAVVFFAAGLK